MGMNFSMMIYAPNFDQWARPITFTPLTSQPGVAGYAARAIFHSDQLETQLEDGSLFIDQRTSIDILESEFPVLPEQLDQIDIPQDGPGGMPAEGTFEIESVTRNGGGETNCVLRKVVTAVP